MPIAEIQPLPPVEPLRRPVIVEANLLCHPATPFFGSCWEKKVRGAKILVLDKAAKRSVDSP